MLDHICHMSHVGHVHTIKGAVVHIGSIGSGQESLHCAICTVLCRLAIARATYDDIVYLIAHERLLLRSSGTVAVR